MGPIEQKAVAGPGGALVFGYAAWAAISYIPVVKTWFPADIQAQIPVYIGFLFAGLAAYLAPHTHRPDLPVPPPKQTAPAQLQLSVGEPQLQPGQPPPA